MNVQTAKTSDLIAFYNANSGRPAIKKFTDRKIAEARVQALLDVQAVTATKPAKPKRDRKPKAEKIVKVKAPRRRDQVYAILVEESVSVAYLAKKLKTCERNIQGDLFFLRKEGYNITRVTINEETCYQLGEKK